MKHILMGAAALIALAGIPRGLAAQAPQVNIDRDRHGNLAHAQEAIVEAWYAIDRAQKVNDARLGGHAGRAKELLDQAMEELRLAADFANSHEFNEKQVPPGE